jgi:hypothetical protein
MRRTTMKRMYACLFLVGCGVLARAQEARPAAPPMVPDVLNSYVGNAEHEFVSAAEAMPEDKYSFAPTSGEFKGVRTFAEEVKHVGAANYLFGAIILQEKSPAEVNDEKGPDSVKTKAEVLKYSTTPLPICSGRWRP